VGIPNLFDLFLFDSGDTKHDQASHKVMLKILDVSEILSDARSKPAPAAKEQ